MDVKTFLVTGCSRGIGLETVKALLAKKYNVIGIARSDVSIEDPNFHFVKGDMKDDSVICKALLILETECGGTLHGLVNNAGILEPIQRIVDMSREKLLDCLQVNFVSAVMVVSKFIPALRKAKGTVVHVSSGASNNPYLGWLAYCSSKAALNMLSAVLAAEEPLITSISLRPGVVNTSMIQESVLNNESAKPAMDPNVLQYMQERSQSDLLIKPNFTGNLIANIVSSGNTKDLSGKFIEWNDPSLSQFTDKTNE